MQVYAISCIDDTAEQEFQKTTMSHQQLPCLALLPDPAPRCQEPQDLSLGAGRAGQGCGGSGNLHPTAPLGKGW